MKKLFLWIYCRPLYQIILFSILLIILYGTINSLLRKHIRLIRKINILLCFVTIFVILYATVLNREAQATTKLNLNLFYKLKLLSIQPEYYREMTMNVFLFLPLGLTLPFTLPERIKRKLLTTCLLGMLFSIIIETLQFFFHVGLCEVNDIIMNLFGTLVGTFAFLMHKIITKILDT